MDNKEYGKYFANLISQRGLSKVNVGDELSKKLGINKSLGRDLVYKYCRGTRRPGVKNIVHLAKILNVSEEQLINGKSSEQDLYLIHLSELFTYKGQMLETSFKKMNKVLDLSKGINPLFGSDEYGRNALDYCWLYRNAEGIMLLIENDIVTYNDYFSSISHVNDKNGKIYLTNLIKLICENNSVELFDICYPHINKYEVIEDFSRVRFKLYTSYIKEDALNYFAKNIDKYPDIEKRLFSLFNLNEKDFLSRNGELIGRSQLMKLPSINELANLVSERMLKLDKIKKEYIKEAISINDSIIFSIKKSGADLKKIKVDDNGRIFYKENEKKYHISTMVKFSFAKALDLAENLDDEELVKEIELLSRQISIVKYIEEMRGK